MYFLWGTDKPIELSWVLNKRQWIMSRTVIVILIYHRHKPVCRRKFYKRNRIRQIYSWNTAELNNLIKIMFIMSVPKNIYEEIICIFQIQRLVFRIQRFTLISSKKWGCRYMSLLVHWILCVFKRMHFNVCSFQKLYLYGISVIFTAKWTLDSEYVRIQ
jgi:hypothetical protein